MAASVDGAERGLDKGDVRHLAPSEIRARIRAGRYTGDTCTGVAPGYAQAAVVGIPRIHAQEFMTFALRNPGPCPILEVTEPGQPFSRMMAPGADLRTDLSKYRVFRDGICVAEPASAVEHWRNDLVGFLIGVTESFEPTMIRAGVRLRHLDEGARGTIFVTNIDCEPAGPFRGRLAVSMRPIHHTQVARAVQITSRFPAFHGAPVHVGDPSAIGISDMAAPWFGEIVEIKDDELPVFWACSVTPQVIAEAARLDYMVTNAPAHLLVCDVPTDQMAIVA